MKYRHEFLLRAGADSRTKARTDPRSSHVSGQDTFLMTCDEKHRIKRNSNGRYTPPLITATKNQQVSLLESIASYGGPECFGNGNTGQ